jgi:FKBP-type peptidyl-prolyl cis-trans isomerase
MNVSATGLYWQVYKKTNLAPVMPNDVVEFSYTTSLLSGKVLYSSEKSGNRTLTIDKNQEEAGLNEGLKYMRLGEKASFIVPPHLAFGVGGDGYMIQPYAVLVFDVEIVAIQ